MEERGRGCHVLIITEATHWMPEGFRIPFSSVHVEVFLKWKVKKEKPKKISYLKKTFPKGWKERPVLPILASSTNLDSLALQFHRVQRDCREIHWGAGRPCQCHFQLPQTQADQNCWGRGETGGRSAKQKTVSDEVNHSLFQTGAQGWRCLSGGSSGQPFFYVGRNKIPLITEATRTDCPLNWSSRNLARLLSSLAQMITDMSGTHCFTDRLQMSPGLPALPRLPLLSEAPPAH